MKISSRDLVGVNTAWVMLAGIAVQAIVHGEKDRSALLIFFAILAAFIPYLFAFPANWRGDLSRKMAAQLPKMLAFAPALIVLPAAFFSEYADWEPRTGFLLALAGVFNLMLFRIFAGKGSVVKPSRWNWFTFLTGLCAGFALVLVRLDVLMAIGGGILYGIRSHQPYDDSVNRR